MNDLQKADAFNFQMSRESILLLAIFFVGLILRIIAALNVGVAADDMIQVSHAIGFIESGKLETYGQSAPVWFFITDMAYRLFGTSDFASRFASIFFGSFSIFLIFLITKEFFGRRTALLSSAIVAFSPLLVKNTIGEMDATWTFLLFASFYFLILALKHDKNYLFYISFILLGVAWLTKLLVVLFIPGYLFFILYYLWKNKKPIFSAKNAYRLAAFFIILLVVYSPVLTHNYLLYKDKGIVDFQFTRMFGLGKDKSYDLYSWDGGYNAKFTGKVFLYGLSEKDLPGFLKSFSFWFWGDVLALVSGIIGIALLLRRRQYDVPAFVFITAILPFVWLSDMLLLPKHYLFGVFLLAMPGAYTLNAAHTKLSEKIQGREKILFILIILLVFAVGMAWLAQSKATLPHFYSKSASSQLTEYAQAIPDDALVISDGRIYRGRTVWAFNSKHYLEAGYFPELISKIDALPGEKIPIKTYFVECVIDDCGWGNIAEQKEFNESMEQIASFFANNSMETIEIMQVPDAKASYPFAGRTELYYRIYRTELVLKKSILNVADSTHLWFLYPLKYDENIAPIFDKYAIHSVFDTLLDKFAHIIMYISFILALISLFVILGMTYAKDYILAFFKNFK